MMGISGDSTGVIIISLSTCLGIERFMFRMRSKQAPRERRRTWSQAAKDLILAEANVPGANVSAVARAHDVSVHQHFRWRREAQMRSAPSRPVAGAPSEPPLSFIEMAPASKTEPASPILAELCEIVVVGVV